MADNDGCSVFDAGIGRILFLVLVSAVEYR